jgi:hypothetical protein
MNTDIKELSYEDELRYLALLTVEGIKPLSRWEMDLDHGQVRTLKRLGLQITTLTRSTEWGRLVTHAIFSRQRSLLHKHRSTFNGRAISFDPQSVRREGLDFGYPPCCVEAFIEFGYQRNGFASRDQGILFHWACPDCEKTRHRLPEYRRIFQSFVSGGVLI